MNVKGRINRLFQRAAGFIRENTEISIFFFFLTTSLFLGDGKQPFIDAWWALGILIMYGVRYYQHGKLDLRPLPRPISFAWAALIVYYIILIPFSDSSGYSVTATMRLVEAYLVYLLFSTTSSDRAIAMFTHGLLFAGTVATLVSFVFFFSPSFANFLPSMNLLYATHGHNHLAGLLLFIFPVVVGLVEKKKGLISVGLLAFFTIGMLLTFARGAWILLVLYLIFLFLQNKNTYLKKIVLVGAAAFVVFFLAVSLLGRREAGAAFSQKEPRLARLIQKPSLLEDGRWEYWRQAMEAIKERPFFGSGPGTFYLQSKRLQARPSSYSWFAHSFPLETMVEAGIVGAILLSLVLVASLRRARASPLFAPLCLTLLYGFFEFNLNYTAVWLLLWAMLGLSFNDKKNNHQRHRWSRGLVVSGLAVLCVFYATSISSAALDVVGNKKLAFFTAPYVVSTAKNYLEQAGRDNQKLTPIEERIVLGFYKKDPEVLKELISVNSRERGLSLFEQTLQLDPQNTKEFERYLQFVVDNGLDGKARFVGQSAIVLGKTALPHKLYEQLNTTGLQKGIFLDAYTKETIATLLEPIEPRLAYSKFFYLLGLREMGRDSKTTLRLWTFSRDLAPWWAHYHLELASLAWYVLKDKNETDAIIKTCLNNKYLKIYCGDKTGDPNLLPQPGSLKQKIMAIPLY